MTNPDTQPPSHIEDDPSASPRAAGRVWMWRWAELALAVVLAGVVFSQFDNPTQHIDELYHVLAAKSLLSDGDLLIAEVGEPYTRARGFTYAVAASFELFGQGLWQSRLPSLLAGLVLIGLVFAWTRWRFGRLSAWLWVGLMLVCPLVIYASELSRFYMVQAAAIAGMLVGCDIALDRALDVSKRAVGAVVLLASTALAMHMQESSIFAVMTIFGGLVFGVLWRMGASRQKPMRWRCGAIGGVVVLGLLGVFVGLMWVEPVQAKWAKYTGAVAWAAGSRDDVSYYLSYLKRLHLWPLVLSPIAAALACWRWRWRGLFVVALFVVGFVGHSFGGMKAPRYLLWALPYFWLTLAIGAQASVELLTDRRREGVATSMRSVRLGIAGAVSLLLAIAVARTTGIYQAKAMLTGGDHAYQYADWPGVLPILKRDSAWDGGVLIASADNKAIDALGRCDYSLSMTRTEGRDEFAMDWRTGLPVISQVESIVAVIEKHPAGMIVIEDAHWREGWSVSHEVADRIEAMTQQVTVGPNFRLKIFRWDRRDAQDPEREPDE